MFELVRLHLAEARSDPDYKFVLAEIDYLKPYFDVYPQDRADLRALIAAGRIEIVGGSYNEPNTNLTCAESTIRNAVYGLAYQRDVLGADPTAAWMLDAFGFDPSYPGLMAQAGMTESSWARGPFHQWGPSRAAGGNTQMQFPAEFEWISPDGNGLLTSYMPNHYSAGWITQHAADLATAEEDAYTQFRQLAPVAATQNVMLPVGGDHVVPSRWATAIHRDWNARYVWPRFVTAVPSEYFAAVRARGRRRRGLDHAADQGHEPGLPRQGRHLHRHQAGAARRRDRAARRRAAGHRRLAGRRASTRRRAWTRRGGCMVFGAHHDAITGHRGRPGLPGPAGRLAGGVRARRPGPQAGDQLPGRAGRHGERGGSLAGRRLAAEPEPTQVTAEPGPGRTCRLATSRVCHGGTAAHGQWHGEVGRGPDMGRFRAVPHGQTGAGRGRRSTRWPGRGRAWAKITLSYEPEAPLAGVRLTDESGDESACLAEGVRRHPDGSLAVGHADLPGQRRPGCRLPHLPGGPGAAPAARLARRQRGWLAARRRRDDRERDVRG